MQHQVKRLLFYKPRQIRYYSICCIITLCLFNQVKAQNKGEAITYASVTPKKLNQTQLNTDFETLQRALVEVYSGIYRQADSMTIERRFDRYKKQLASIHHQTDFISLLTKLIASFREGHMRVEYDNDTDRLLNSTRLFPFTVMVENEKLKVHDNETGSDQTIRPGMEILSINGYKTGQLIKAMIPHIPADGYGYAHRNKRLANNFPQNFWLYFGQQDSFTIKAKDGAGRVIITKVTGVTEEQRQNNIHALINKQMMQAVRKLDGTAENISLSFTNEGKTGTLRIKAFKGNDFTSELDSVFRLINQKSTKTLILDLRGNGGGDDTYGAALVSHVTSAPFRYFKKIQMRTIRPSFDVWNDDILNILRTGTIADPVDRYHLTGAVKDGLNIQQPSTITFNGRLFVLTDGYTFSTAADAAAVIRQITSAFFIGEETGGGAEGNTSGLFAQIKLPNSNLSVNIPALCYSNAVTVRKKNRGVLPDHPLINTINDILNNNDRQWKYAVALALKSNE